MKDSSERYIGKSRQECKSWTHTGKNPVDTSHSKSVRRMPAVLKSAFLQAVMQCMEVCLSVDISKKFYKLNWISMRGIIMRKEEAVKNEKIIKSEKIIRL